MGASYRGLLSRLDSLRSLGVDLGLDRMRRTLQSLGAPESRFASVQIAGTNGKGSTAAMTESILRAAGVKTGLYTSPHLARFTERIRIDGHEVDGDRLGTLDGQVAATGVPLTYFEVATTLALLAFAEAGVELAVLETGLGGRLDATTVVPVLATAITSISLDHTELLGGTIVEIAREKAGIIRPGVPLLLGRVPPEAEQEIVRVAAERRAAVFRTDFDLPDAPAEPSLQGPHQRSNAALAVGLARLAAARLGRPLDDETVVRGLAEVHWPGRLELLRPGLLLDCAHNPEGVEALLRALPAAGAAASPRGRVLVTSVVRGKDARAMLGRLAPAFDHVIATRSRNPRALPPGELVAALPPGVRWSIAEPPLAAIEEARRTVGEGGLVVVAGSIFLVGEVRAQLLGEELDPDPAADPL